MKELTKFKVNPLYRDVVKEIIKDSQDYEEGTPEESLLARLDDISRHGLSNSRAATVSLAKISSTSFIGGISKIISTVCVNENFMLK